MSKKKYGRGTGNPHPVDIHVGFRLRKIRESIGVSQEDLGKKTGVTFQQLQKYESGRNRISASMLYDIGDALGVEPCYFFENYTPRKSAMIQLGHAPVPVQWSRLYHKLQPSDRPPVITMIQHLIERSEKS